MRGIRLRGASARRMGACAALLPLLVLLASGCGATPAGGPVKVAVSIVPLADFAREIGGGHVTVQTLIPPGASPHTFDPTAGQFAFLSDARLLVTNGLELEGWVSDTIAKVGNDGMRRVAAAEAVPEGKLLKAAEEDSEGPFDPHVWLDPSLAEYQVDAIARGLAAVDPVNEAEYLANAATYKGKLRALDRELAERTGSFSRKEFVALHPAWRYFARRYGLTQAAAIEELPGKEPSGRLIAAIIDDIEARRIPVVFAEPQTSPRAAEAIAHETGARVLTIDPLGDPGKREVSTYLRMMRHNADVMGEALR